MKWGRGEREQERERERKREKGNRGRMMFGGVEGMEEREILL